VIGHDMRDSGPGLAAAFARGANAAGTAGVNIGLASTDQLSYPSGALNLPGAMFPPSHNPARYNGIKLCRPGARPVGQDTGLPGAGEGAGGWAGAREGGAEAP